MLNLSIFMIVLLLMAHLIACMLGMLCNSDLNGPQMEDIFEGMDPGADPHEKYFFFGLLWGLSVITVGPW